MSILILFYALYEILLKCQIVSRRVAQYQPEGGKYFLAGISNGGLSAFRIILNTPERFRALIIRSRSGQQLFDQLETFRKGG